MYLPPRGKTSSRDARPAGRTASSTVARVVVVVVVAFARRVHVDRAVDDAFQFHSCRLSVLLAPCAGERPQAPRAVGVHHGRVRVRPPRRVAKRALVDFGDAKHARPRALTSLSVHEASRGREPHERLRAPRVRATQQRVEPRAVLGLVVLGVVVARVVFGFGACRRRWLVLASTRRRCFLESLVQIRARPTASSELVGRHRAFRGSRPPSRARA